MDGSAADRFGLVTGVFAVPCKSSGAGFLFCHGRVYSGSFVDSCGSISYDSMADLARGHCRHLSRGDIPRFENGRAPAMDLLGLF